MKPVAQLVRIAHGSHLYGTSTPSSDRDYKGVHLPSGEAIILQRAEDVLDRGIRSKITGTDKNAADAVDDESYSLQKFFGMLAKGDTVATEILFAPTPIDADPIWRDVQGVGRQLLNRQCKGLVNYCVRQAAKYGIKGSRLNAVRRLLDLLEVEASIGHGTLKLATIADALQAFAAGQEHADWVNIPSPNGDALWHIDCCDRKMPMTAAIEEAHKVYATVWDNYGKRARAAMTNEGIDWKAMSHAVRVARQAIELFNTGRITFPRPDAAELIEIKKGMRSYEEISALLEKLVAEVQDASQVSTLPEQTNASLADRQVRDLYLSQIGTA